MRSYEIYDFEKTNNFGQDEYYYVYAKSPVDAIKSYMKENKLTGKIVRTISDTNTRFIVSNTRGKYLYQLIKE